jgi:hypothetical protein
MSYRRRVRNVIPFNVDFPGGARAKVTWDSVIWFGVVTTAASILGSYLWEYVLQPNLPSWAQTWANNPTVAPAPTSTSKVAGIARLHGIRI